MNRSVSRLVIGGEFEADESFSLGSFDQLSSLTRSIPGTWVSSGRAAFGSILKELKARGVQHVHLPAYLCESIILSVEAIGLEYSFYPVDSSLVAHPDPSSGSAVVIIHYFGWLNPVVKTARAQNNSFYFLIEDFSHALLSEWGDLRSDQINAFFSVRKFGPVPLGGWGSFIQEPKQPTSEIESIAWQSLAARFIKKDYLSQNNSVPPGYDTENLYLTAFENVESFLDKHPNETGVPKFAYEIIAALNWQLIAEQRRANWKYLYKLISDTFESIYPDLNDGVVPLGYVIRLDAEKRDKIRQTLYNQRIFCPVHWQLPQEVDHQNFANADQLSKTLLTLPIDQRYNFNDMEIIAKALKDAIKQL